MKNAKNGDSKKSIKKKKISKLIRLEQEDRIMAETEYKKYYNRMKLSSRGLGS